MTFWDMQFFSFPHPNIVLVSPENMSDMCHKVPEYETDIFLKYLWNIGEHFKYLIDQ